MARRRSLKWIAPALLTALAGCQSPEELPPNAEAIVFVDTDLDVGAITGRLQIDIYDADLNWFEHREELRDRAALWPVSFALTHPNEKLLVGGSVDARDVYLRLRLYPDGKTQDYRGEKFFPPPSASDDPSACPGAPPEGYFDDKKLLARGADGALAVSERQPKNEPLPLLAIDRLVRIRLVPGELRAVRVTLRGACLGAKANLFDRTSCVDTEGVMVPVVEEPRSLDRAAPRSSEVATFPPPAPCPPSEVGGDDVSVCVDGGSFIMGDPGVFANGVFSGIPERFAFLPALRVDRYEVSVGRFRAALDAGALAGAPPPIANDGPLAEGSLDGDDAHSCTFSTQDVGREDYPLNCVSFETARAFCSAAGGDLPTEAQWEWLAAAAGRLYQDSHAWGSSDPSCDKAVYAREDDPLKGAIDCDSSGYGVQPISASLTGDVTPVYGIVGMAGSLREWTLDGYRPYCSNAWRNASLFDPICDDDTATKHTLRGCDWSDSAERLLAGLRDQGELPDTTTSRIGFRCVAYGGPR